LKAHTTTFADPFLGNTTVSLSSNLEAGFQLLLVFIQQISGLSWESLFRYFPSVITVITVLSVYILARKLDFGWEAALLTSIIPTSIGILGPAYLVPVSLGLVYLPLGLFVAFYLKTRAVYLLLFILTTFLLAVHAPSAICLGIVLAPYILLNLRGHIVHAVVVLLALVLPFFLVFPWIFSLLLPTAKALLQPISPQNIQGWTTYTELPILIQSYGYFPIALGLLGVFTLYIKGGREKTGLVSGLLALLTMLAVFYTFHYGVWIVYLRGLVFTLLMMGIVGGAGLMAIKNLRLPERINTIHIPELLRNIGYPLCLMVILVTLSITIPARQEAYYYHMIDEADYVAFNWIQKNVPVKYTKAVLDPWKATAFSALTGKNTFTKLHSTISKTDIEAQTFLRYGSSDTSFLANNGISVVYSRDPVLNYDLIKVRENVFLLPR
jgi:hypothetical protein